MTYSLFDRCGWNPTEVHARLYGRKPAGIVVVTAEERAQAEREAIARETQPPPPLEVKEEGGDPPQPVPAKAGGEVADAPMADRGGSPPGATPDGSCEDADPRHHPAATGAPARPAPADDLPPAGHSSRLHPPPRAGEDRDELDVPARLSASPGLKDWLVRNWETIAALEAAGDLADFAAPTPREPADAAPPPPLPPVHVRKGDRWNRPKMADFLRQLAATHSVSAAARSVGMSRESAYRLRNRLKGQPFDIAWEAAFRQGYDNLAHAALDRAVNGVEVPHYCNGELVGTSRRYDERLTVALLAMRNRYGAPQMGRYGAAAEWWSERWDAMLQRVESGSLDWQDEQRALGQPLDGGAHVQALINKHAPDEGPVTPRRR